MTQSGMLGSEGRRALEDQEASLFPRSVRPSFLRLLWITLAALAVASGVLLAALGGRLR